MKTKIESKKILHPHFKLSKRYWLVAWIGTPLLVLLGMGIYYLLGPAVVGLVTSLPFTLLALWLLWRSNVFAQADKTISQSNIILVHN